MAPLLAAPLLVAPAAVASAAAGQGEPLPDVAVIVYNPTTGRTLQLDEGAVEVRAREVVPEEGATLEGILQARGIYPDAEAYAVVYELNPGLEGPQLRAGEPLVVPVVEGPDDLRAALAADYRAYLSSHPGLKERIVESASELAGRLDRIEALPPARFGGAGARERALESLGEVRAFADALVAAIQERTYALDSELLGQVERLLTRAGEVSAEILADDGPVGEDWRRTVDLLGEAAAVRLSALVETRGDGGGPGPYPTVEVVVRALDPDDGSEVHRLRVYFVEEFDYGRRDGTPFQTLTSPARMRLDVANYRLWIGDRDRNPISEVLPLKLARGGVGDSVLVELLVEPAVDDG